MSTAVRNPFPGLRPYQADERDLFFGREDATRELAASILAQRCLTVYGPSGAGKSSILRTAVLPALADAHEIRSVCIDRWPDGQPPLVHLAEAMCEQLAPWQPGPEPGPETAPGPDSAGPLDAAEAVMLAVERGAHHSQRVIVVYLDQLEQLLYPGRDPAECEALLAVVDRLVKLPVRQLRLVLSVREDYLGTLQDRLRARRGLLEHRVRVGPLAVAAITDAVCRAAARGNPAQTWLPVQMEWLMLETRTPGQAVSSEAEVQTAYVQIVCRALFDERAAGRAPGLVAAEAIVQRHLEATLASLGERAARARHLLEEQLIAADGRRTLRAESELAGALAGALDRDAIRDLLAHLEAAAVLRAEQRQGQRFFELGHDWLARKHEQRQRREVEHRRERARRRGLRLGMRAGALLLVALGVTALAMMAYRATARLEVAESRGHDALLMAAYHRMQARDTATAVALLREIEAADPAEHVPGWRQAAWDMLSADVNLTVLLSSPEETRATPALAFSPDGTRVLTASEDGTVRVWRADGLGAPIVLRGHRWAVRSVAFSPDGTRVLATSDDGTALLWRADGLGEPIELRIHRLPISHAAFSPDGTRVVLALRDGTAWVRRLDGAGQPIVLRGHERVVEFAAFSPDGTHVVLASRDGTARVWRADGLGEPVVLRGHEKDVVSAQFSPDGTRVVTASEDGTARVWRADGLGEPIVLRGHQKSVRFAAFSPDGTRVATTSEDGSARMWRVDGEGEPVVLHDHDREVHSVVLSPDRTRVVTASRDGTARVRRMDGTGVPIVLRCHDEVLSAVFSPDGTRVVTVSRAGTARVWNADGEGAPLVLRGHEKHVVSAEFSPDGTRAVTSSEDGTARVWNADGESAPIVLRGHQGTVGSAEFSPDGSRVVTVSEDGTARVWAADGASEPIVLRGDEKAVGSAAFSPDGTHVVTESRDRTVWLWRADGEGEPIVFRNPDDGLIAVDFGPDGLRVVTGSLGTARLWRAGGEGEPIELRGHRKPVMSSDFSPDGTRLVTASNDATARIWRVDGEGEPIVLGHESTVSFAAFSPDGTRVVTGSWDRTVRVWRADGEGEPIVLRGPGQSVRSVSFSPDGTRVVTKWWWGGARYWNEDGTTVTMGPRYGVVWIWKADGSGDPIVLGSNEDLVVSVALSPDSTRAITAMMDGTARIWPLTSSELMSRLWRATPYCLPPGQRRALLGETEDTARERHEACRAEVERRARAR
jgi:WD40 repeat protein